MVVLIAFPSFHVFSAPIPDILYRLLFKSINNLVFLGTCFIFLNFVGMEICLSSYLSFTQKIPSPDFSKFFSFVCACRALITLSLFGFSKRKKSFSRKGFIKLVFAFFLLSNFHKYHKCFSLSCGFPSLILPATFW